MGCYGHLGYGNIGTALYTGFKDTNNPLELRFNKEMSSVRISVEWMFKRAPEYVALQTKFCCIHPDSPS